MRIDVNCSSTYPIIIEKGCLQKAKEYIGDDRRILIISDDMVPKEYIQCLQKQFSKVDIKIVKHGEQAKSLAVYEDCLSTLLELNYARKDLVVALGGGVVGDLAGFVAATYKRGIGFINIPTTTLAQIDSSIGGKVAINMQGIKNCVGAFYQPNLVLIDPLVLASLPARHYHNGLAEAIKAGLIGDPQLFALFEAPTLDIEQIIYRSLLVKKRVVEIDEKENGLRKILNFGHTFGHAYESYYQLKDYYHGECVALGMMRIIQDAELKKRLASILERLALPTKCAADHDHIMELIKSDKKADHDLIDIVEISSLGQAKIKTCHIHELRAYLDED
ncbi:MAG: 3-dehydroquinate synthase [Erysipelotrichaceae bacterium]|nr:3-dehydroquinate synthase [Erysipelotrichaceae bacterium]MDY5252624.1 3-dehydroquinate synthase [Erysipelotrichaceae bacterium]